MTATRPPFRRRPVAVSIIVLLFACALAAAPASAQSETGGLATIGVSAAFGGESTDAAITAALGYRVTRRLAITLELTALPGLTPELPDPPEFVIAAIGPLIFPPPLPEYFAEGGHGTFFTGNLRLDVPTGGGWQPYLVAGAGAGTIVERVRVRVAYPPLPLAFTGSGALPPGVVLPDPLLGSIVLPSFEQVIESTATAFATTIGGGVAFRMSDHLTFDVDARYLALFGRRDRHLARVGGGVTARF